MMPIAALILMAADVISSPMLGTAEARCRTDERGPAFLVDVVGLKDHAGLLKVEVYPATPQDFLADDDVLVREGKTFRRVEVPVPPQPVPQLCVRVPGPGVYAVAVLHDRNANHKFNLSTDGIGFSNNPRLGFGKPRAATVAIRAGNYPTRINVVMNYRHGLFSFRPLAR